MSNTPLSYNTRFYVKNPDAAYDPAPLREFDDDVTPHPPTAVPGDVISAWSRIGNEAEGRNRHYKVIDRTFRYQPSGPIRVFILVEEIQGNWSDNFN